MFSQVKVPHEMKNYWKDSSMEEMLENFTIDKIDLYIIIFVK
jgi:hypothetical protein